MHALSDLVDAALGHVVELASAIRIGDAAVVDARLLGERFEGLRWGWAA